MLENKKNYPEYFSALFVFNYHIRDLALKAKFKNVDHEIHVAYTTHLERCVLKGY